MLSKRPLRLWRMGRLPRIQTQLARLIMNNDLIEQRLVAFRDASAFALSVVNTPAVSERWASPSAVQRFSVRGLVAHMVAALRRMEVGLATEVSDDAVNVGLTDFYGANRIDGDSDRLGGLHDQIVSHAEAKATEGFDAAVAKLRDVIERLLEILTIEALQRRLPVVQVPNGATYAHNYLVTRVIELLVHTDDVAVSVGIDAVPPEIASTAALNACLEIARGNWGDLDVLRTFARAERSSLTTLRVL